MDRTAILRSLYRARLGEGIVFGIGSGVLFVAMAVEIEHVNFVLQMVLALGELFTFVTALFSFASISDARRLYCDALRREKFDPLAPEDNEREYRALLVPLWRRLRD